MLKPVLTFYTTFLVIFQIKFNKKNYFHYIRGEARRGAEAAAYKCDGL